MAEVLDPKDRLDDLLFIARHLIEILEQENIALEKDRMDLIHQSLDQKTKLSRAYEIRVIGLQQSGQDFSDIEPVLVEELKQQSDRLQELVEINERELKIKLDVGKMYVDVIAESVKSATPSAGTYGSRGATDKLASGEKVKSAPIAIDENL